MRNTLYFLLVLAVSFVAMMAFRALAVTSFAVEGDGLAPTFLKGDHVLVNRWSYGLRTGGGDGLFPYGRLCRQEVEVGDIVAYDDPTDNTGKRVLIGRCQALPGDTVEQEGTMLVMPSRKDCADADYYWIKALGKGNPTDSRLLGPISERHIIGRAFIITFNHDASQPFWRGWRNDRILLLP